jgi:thiosulfate dehydrogenase (quinone) large subunit
MAKPTRMQSHAEWDWRSDSSVAYALLRFTFGVNICFRGIVRIVHGTDGFAAAIVGQLAPATVLSPSVVSAYGHVVPWVEATIGLLMMAGLLTRPALIAGGLMMASLTFGTMLVENFQNAFLQLSYSIVFFLLLALRSWNLISLDSLIWPSESKAPNVEMKK